MTKTIKKYFLLLLFFLLSGTGCGRLASSTDKCTILLEDNDRIFYSRQIFEVDRYTDLSFSVGVPVGERISSVNYDGYTLSAKAKSSESYDYYTLTLHNIRYSAIIRLETDLAYTTIYTSANDGEDIVVEENSPHLTFNTLPYEACFTREGYVPIGFNTMPDGTGLSIGFGSRVDHRNASALTLYPEWLPATDASLFSYVLLPDSDKETSKESVSSKNTASKKAPESENASPSFCVCITGFLGDYTTDIVIPSYIDGFPVTDIASGAFTPETEAVIHRLYLPPTLQRIEPDAFSSLQIQDLYLFDSLKEVSDLSFTNVTLNHLHLNAATAPVYSGSYFDTFSDKFDTLKDAACKKKMVLFCGSSARFGYDSALLASAFPDMEIVNMGVYAYSNMLPQADLVLSCMKEGDILLSSPELDAIDTQFCGETALDKETFAMMESNYDMFASLDCSSYTKVFDALGEYLLVRSNMPPRSYDESASSYDEDGLPVSSPSYNRYGDYILYRENNFDRRTFGIKRAFYNVSHIRKQDWEGLNAVYDRFAQKGVRVLFTYSPRSRISISEDSTEESIKELDQTLREKLHATVISNIEDSLMDPLYFYGTDNHLSTEGAALRTKQVISDLESVLQSD